MESMRMGMVGENRRTRWRNYGRRWRDCYAWGISIAQLRNRYTVYTTAAWSRSGSLFTNSQDRREPVASQSPLRPWLCLWIHHTSQANLCTARYVITIECL